MLNGLKISADDESHPKVLFFEPSVLYEELYEKVAVAVRNSAAVEVLREVDALERRLRSPGLRFSAMVLFVPDDRTMRELSEIMWLLEDVQLVAVIPDDDNQILSNALKLRPRYLTTLSDASHNIVRVLENML